MAWTDEQRAAIIKAYYEAGESASEIAARYHVSRNSIIGLAGRHRAKTGRGLKSNAAPRKPSDPTAPRKPSGARPPAKPKAGLDFATLARLDAANARIIAAASPPRSLGLPAAPVADARFVAWGDLGQGECRFAVTPHHVAPRDHRFCGRHADDGPYCRPHSRLAHA